MIRLSYTRDNVCRCSKPFYTTGETANVAGMVSAIESSLHRDLEVTLLYTAVIPLVIYYIKDSRVKIVVSKEQRRIYLNIVTNLSLAINC